ncbi:Copia protein, partial [Mucuna pruriens]
MFNTKSKQDLPSRINLNLLCFLKLNPKSIDNALLDKDKPIIKTKWVLRNKLIEIGKVVRNKAKLEGIDSIETFTPIAKLEVIHILLSFASHNHVRLHQMDVKCSFFNEAYLWDQTSTLCLVEKLSYFLMENVFTREKVDTTLFCKNYDSHFITVQIYVDDVIFGATDESLCEEFSKLMQKEF